MSPWGQKLWILQQSIHQHTDIQLKCIRLTKKSLPSLQSSGSCCRIGAAAAEASASFSIFDFSGWSSATSDLPSGTIYANSSFNCEHKNKHKTSTLHRQNRDCYVKFVDHHQSQVCSGADMAWQQMDGIAHIKPWLLAVSVNLNVLSKLITIALARHWYLSDVATFSNNLLVTNITKLAYKNNWQ